jgi:integrase
LPTGLHQDKWGTYFYRASKGDDRAYHVIGKVGREAAIRAWVKLTTRDHDDAETGTVAELIDRYLRDEIGTLAKATRQGYEFHCGKLRARWGEKKYAITVVESLRSDVLRVLDIATYLREARAAPKGYKSARAAVAVLAVIFSHGPAWGLTAYNPCRELPKQKKDRKAKSYIPTFEQITAAAERAKPRLRLMIEWAWRTGWRETDILCFQIQQIPGDRLPLTQSKTGVDQDWEVTPELRSILDRAAKLPGRSRSMFVFPQRNGKPVTLTGFQSDWRRLKAGFQFRAIRKWAINQKIAAGENAADFAGHSDPRTTRQHYDQTPKKVSPL